MKTLFLAETAQQVADLVKREKAKDADWVALTPFAMHELDRKGVAYRIVDDFYNEEELWKIALECERREKEIFRRLDDFALSRSAELKKRQLKLYTHYAYPLYMVFDAVFLRVFHLNAMLESVRPDEIFCRSPKPLPFFRWFDLAYIGFDKRESLYAGILKKNDWSKKVRFIESSEPENNTQQGKGFPVRIFPEIDETLIIIKDNLSFFRNIRKCGLIDSLKIALAFLRKKTNLTLVGSGYEWDECEYLFNLSGARLRRLSLFGAGIEPYKPSAGIENEIHAEIKDLMVFMGFDLSGMVLSRLAYIYDEGAKRCLAAYDQAVMHIDRYKPRALLFSTLPMPEMRSAALAFNQRRIPSFCKPHGIFGITEVRKFSENDLIYTNYYLANGPQMKKVYSEFETSYSGNNLKVLSTGSPKIQRRKKSRARIPAGLKDWLKDANKNGSKKVGVYATSNYLQNFLYATFKPVPSDTARFNSQKIIIDFFKKRNDCLLIWKLHPNPISDRPPRIEDAADNILVVRSESAFTDLLNHADFVVMDDAFTLCQEAASTDKPMFVLMKHIRYYQAAREMLEKRAVCCDETRDLLAKLDDFILNGVYDADTDNDVFLKAFSINENGACATYDTTSFVMNSLCVR